VTQREGVDRWATLATFAAGALVFWASLLNLLRHDGYPLLATEVLPVYAALAVLSISVGGVYLVLPRWLQAGLDGLLVALAIDMNTANSQPAALVGGAVACAISLLMRKRPLLPLIAFMATVVLLLGLVGVGAKQPAKAATQIAAPAKPSSLPLLVHVILDEHAGVEGLPAENSATPAFREELKRSYIDRGFRLYGRAYSEHMHTRNAIPRIMNLGVAPPSKRNEGTAVRGGAYLDRLSRAGYAITVYQSTFLDLCSGRRDVRCFEYQEGGLEHVHESSLSHAAKAGLIARNFVALSDLAVRPLRAYDKFARLVGDFGVPLPALDMRQSTKTSTLQGFEASEALLRDLGDARPGEAYIAHLLLPHYPYAYKPDCSLKPWAEWTSRSGPMIRLRERAYFDQIRCSARVIGAIDKALDRSVGPGNYILIVHGDHGSRITVKDPRADRVPTERDLIASYSTLFAIKAPQVTPGYETGPAPVDKLLQDFVRRDFAGAPSPTSAPALIMLEDEKQRPKRQTTLPQHWLATRPAPPL